MQTFQIWKEGWTVMQPDPDEDPFASAAAEFQAAIQNYQAETTKKGAPIPPSPVASSPVESPGLSPVPNPLEDKQRNVAEQTNVPPTPMQNQTIPGTMPGTMPTVPGTMPGTMPTIPGTMPTSQPNPVMLAGQPQSANMIPMGSPMGMAVPPTTNAVLALVLAILGWVGCGICTSLPALFVAQSAIKTTSAYPNHPDSGMANAAKWVSLINVILSVLVILFYVVLFAGLAASGDFDAAVFVCDNGDTIPSEWVNDGDNDCGDWSDESR